jgi:hypothetical protein
MLSLAYFNWVICIYIAQLIQIIMAYETKELFYFQCK